MLRKQVLDSSRGRVLRLLQRGGLTADDIASALRITTNAVREHLAGLERDGLVQRTGQRPGTTRPSQIFELTPDADLLLSQAYVPFLAELVRVVAEGLPAGHVELLMRRTGERLADQLAPRRRPRGLRARVRLASHLLNEHLGAVTRVEENGSYLIRGAACPLAALTAKHPSVCLAVESLVAKIVGVPVHERCDRAGRACCCFEIERA
jgi:predicted ArsR family transcriptional regulator